MNIKNIGNNYKVAYNLLGQPSFMQGMLASDDNPSNGVYAYNCSPTAKAALKLRADAIAQPELMLVDKNGNEIEKHPILDLLTNVNDDLNYSDLMKQTESDLLVFPFAMWLKGRETISGQGRVRKLYPLNPLYIQLIPVATNDNRFTDWYYLYSPPFGATARYTKADIIYFKGQYNPSYNYIGTSPLASVKNACLAEKYVSEYLNVFFQNGAMPGVIFSSDNPIGKEDTERISKNFKENYGGVKNWFRTLMLLGNGLKPQVIGWNVKDLDLAVVRQELVKEICKALRVPELLVTQSNAADLTPVAQGESIFWNMTIKPQLNWYAEVLNNNLLTEYPDLVLSGAHLAFGIDEIVAHLHYDANKYEANVREDFKAGLISGEAARRELGYTETDAPPEPPAPVVAPIAVQPGSTPVNATEQPTAATTAQTAPELPTKSVEADLQRWQKKSLKAFGEGKPALVRFESDVISAIEHERISKALKTVQTKEEVLAAFEKRSEPSTDEKILNQLTELVEVVRNNVDVGSIE